MADGRFDTLARFLSATFRRRGVLAGTIAVFPISVPSVNVTAKGKRKKGKIRCPTCSKRGCCACYPDDSLSEASSCRTLPFRDEPDLDQQCATICGDFYEIAFGERPLVAPSVTWLCHDSLAGGCIVASCPVI